MNKSIIKGRVFYSLAYAQATTLFMQFVCLRVRVLIHYCFICFSLMHLVQFRFRINHTYFSNHRRKFFENRMIAFLQLYSYTKVSRITDAQNSWKMSTDVHRKR